VPIVGRVSAAPPGINAIGSALQAQGALPVLFGKLGNQHASGLVSGAIAILTISLVLMLPASHSTTYVAVLGVFWGIAIMIIGLGMQVKVLSLAPDATDVAMSLFSGIFNLGIGAGALVGNQVSLHWSMANVGYVGAVPALAALVWSVVIFRRWPTVLEEHPALEEQTQ